MKIYSSGNNFVIEEKGVTYSTFYRNVIINKIFGTNGGVPYYSIKNVEGWNSSTLINIPDVTNDTGMYYTATSFEKFFKELIGKAPTTDPSVPSHVSSILVQDISDWNTAFNKRLVGAAVTGDTDKTLTLTFGDSTVLTASFNVQGGVSDGDNYINTLDFNSLTGVLTVGRTGVLTDIATSLDGRYLTSIPAHTHTKTEITDFEHTHTWGDITGVPDFILNETDPTVPVHVKSITTQDVSNWIIGFNNNIISGSVTGDTSKILTLTKRDGTTLSIPFSDLQGLSTDDVINTLNFNSATGVITAVTSEGVQITTNFDGRYSLLSHTHPEYEHPSKTWVDKTSLINAEVINNLTVDSLGHPTGWSTRTLTPANIGAAPVSHTHSQYLETETDPTVPTHVKSITTTDISNWNTASGGASASIPTWTASVFTLGSTVTYGGTIWRATSNTVSTQIPGENIVWLAVTDIVDGGVLHLNFTPVGLVYTWKNYIIEYVSDESDDLRFTKDTGKTWTTWVNPHGAIAKVHIFTDGTVMFCSTTKVFTTKDFITVTESTVLDFDGQPLIPNAVHFFSINDQTNPIVIIDGVEVLAWGDYMIRSATGQDSYKSRMWYTTDYGATLKCTIKVGVTQISGGTYSPRHMHCTGYNKHRNKFILTSGDEFSQCKVVQSTYTPSTDTWEHELMQEGYDYKFGNVYFDEHYTYFITDYTVAGYLRGIKRCNSDMLNISSAYEYIYKSDNEVKPLIGYYEDTNGNRILTGDDQAAGEFYYAKNDFNFKKITHNQNNPIIRLTSVNYNGDQYAMMFKNYYSEFSDIRNKYINITQGFRDAGVYDFNQEKVILGKNENTKYEHTDTVYDDTVIQSEVDLNTAKETNIAHPLVETAVPSGALFTDTVYNDTTIQLEVDDKLDKTTEIQAFVSLTQAEYDAGIPVATTLYIING